MIEMIIYYIDLFFLIYIFIYALLFFISSILAVLDLNELNLRKRYKNNLEIQSVKNYIPISILIPAYNEEETIIDCIESNLKLDYPTYEVIVINDGSTDMTASHLIEHFNLRAVGRPVRQIIKTNEIDSIYEGVINERLKLTLINKQNGGKADALNVGINVSSFPLFVSLDADSILQRDSLNEIVKPYLENENTIAVGGNIKVSNRMIIENGQVVGIARVKSFFVIMQLIEYYRVFLMTRVFFNKFNGNLIISGAFGLFQKKAVLNVGGYNNQTIGEDMDLVMKLHSFYLKNELDYSIQYSHTAICWSQMPNKLRDLKNQRRRWHIGLMTSTFEHFYMFLKPQYKTIGMFSFLYFIVYELLSCLLDIVGLVVIIGSYFLGIINLPFFLTFMLIYISYSVSISLAAISLERYIFKLPSHRFDGIKLFFYCLIENFGYRQLISYFRLTAFFVYRKQKHSWNKIQRETHNKTFIETKS